MHQGNEQTPSAENFICALNQRNSAIHYQINTASFLTSILEIYLADLISYDYFSPLTSITSRVTY